MALHTVFPRLHISLDEVEPIDGLAALRSWRADIALIDDLSAVADGWPASGISLIRLTEDVLYALEHRRSLSVSDLRQEDWALDSTSSAYGDFILNLCRRNGFQPRLNASCKGFEMVAAMVASGCSVSVAYRSGEKEHPAVKVFVEEVVRAAAGLGDGR